MNSSVLRLLVVGAACALVSSAFAGELDEVKQRMRARVPAVDALKTSGAVGEASTGLLAVRIDGGDAAAIVSAENADRTLIFAETARRTGATAEAVAAAFARQMAASSKAGVWLQRADGEWYQK
jgi:uncharacterized protein